MRLDLSLFQCHTPSLEELIQCLCLRFMNHRLTTTHNLHLLSSTIQSYCSPSKQIACSGHDLPIPRTHKIYNDLKQSCERLHRQSNIQCPREAADGSPATDTIQHERRTQQSAGRDREPTFGPHSQVGLRQALGQSLVERSYYELDGHDYRLAEFDEPPVVPRIGKGMSGTAQPREECHVPWQFDVGLRQRLAHSIELVQLGSTEVRDVLVQVLDIPTTTQALSHHLVEAVEQQGLLAGYSALATVGGCLYIAAYALQIPLGSSSQDLEQVGLNFHGTRCAYNELWRQRDELADVLQKGGGSVEKLRFPIAPDGGVLKRMLKADAERKRAETKEETVHGGGRRAALKRVWSRVQGRLSSRVPEGE